MPRRAEPSPGPGIAWWEGEAAGIRPWAGRGVAAWCGPTAAADGPAPAAADLEEAARRPAPLRAAFLRRRATQRLCLSRWLGIAAAEVVVGTLASGRPVLLAPHVALYLSSASRGPWQAVALSHRPVGIDVEPLGDAPPAWAMLSAAERGRVAGLPANAQPAAFLAAWTAKEAVLKALGTGLDREPSGLTVEPDGTGGFRITCGDRPLPLAAAAWRSAVIGSATLQLAVASLGSGWPSVP